MYDLNEALVHTHQDDLLAEAGKTRRADRLARAERLARQAQHARKRARRATARLG